MAYADYAFYKGTYKGNKLSEAEFDRLSERASDYIDSRTDYILHKSGIPPDMEIRLKKACCAVAETYRSCESGGVKLSESVDGYSVSYRAYDAKSAAESKKRVDDAVKRYIANTGLMFRGCG